MAEKMTCPNCGKRTRNLENHKCEEVNPALTEEEIAAVMAEKACDPEWSIDPELIPFGAQITGAKKGSEYLRYYFTQDEKLETAETMSNAFQRRAGLKEELAHIQAQFKADISKEEETIAACARTMHSGYEMRNVEVFAFMNYESRQVVIRRADTGEVVKVRPMNTSELQRDLPLEEEVVDAEFQDGTGEGAATARSAA